MQSCVLGDGVLGLLCPARRAVQLNKYSSGYEVRGGGTGI